MGSMQYVMYGYVYVVAVQDGLTALHLAALYGSEKIVRVLVQEFQMNPDTADYVSSTFHPM